MHAHHLPEVAFLPERVGAMWRGEVIDVHSKHRLARTVTTYTRQADAIAAATSLWRAKQMALLRLTSGQPQQVVA